MRLDGLTPATQTSPLRRFLPQVMPNRTDAVLFFEIVVRHAPIHAYLDGIDRGPEDPDPTGLFHVVLTAVLRTLAERPRLNRTVIGGRIFDRETLAMTFSVKKGKRDDARLVSTKVVFAPTDTLEDVRRRVAEAIRHSRDPQAHTASEASLARLERLPRFAVRGLMRTLRRIERVAGLPPALTRDDPSHTSLFVANLGSIGLDASFHHLSNTGTASIHLTIGEIAPRVVVSDQGSPEVADTFTLRLAIDDRIVDGFYCARSLERLKHWLSHPEALGQPWPPRDDLVVARLWQRARETPEGPAYALRSTTEDAWFATSWSSLLEEVRAAGRALIDLGVQPGDRVAIQGSNRPEWTVTYLGAQAIGGIPTGLHEDLAPDDLSDALRIARPTVILLETDGPVDRVRRTCPEARVVSMLRQTDDAMTWTDFLARGRHLDDGEVERRLAAIDLDDPAVAVFTSGTSGEAKAAVLSHRNLAWTADRAIAALDIGPHETTVSYLPLSHVAEQNFTIVVALAAGATVAYAPSRGGVVDTLREYRPTVFFGVPQIWSRIAREMDGGLASVGLDRVRIAVSGAAGLDPALFARFADAGLPLLQTYGQTEGCGPTSLTRPGDARPGTCGPAFPGVDIRLADDGEILFRGGNVFLGYLDDPQATRRTLVDGWIHTGDRGAFVSGHLQILGRKKALIVTSGGDNVAPEPIEARLESQPLIDRAVVVGDGRPFVTALLTLDGAGVVEVLGQHGIGATDGAGRHPRIREALDAAIASVNATLSPPARIRSFAVLPRPLTPEDGTLTPTLKLRRTVILDRWADPIARLYADRRPRPPRPRRVRPSGFSARPATAPEHADLFALRHLVFCEAGHLAPGHFPDGRLEDRFDANALQFALHDESGSLAGTARFIPGQEDLAVEALFDFDRLDIDRARVGEIGRLAIDPRWRGRRAPIVTLIRGILAYTESIEVPHVYAFVPARSIRGYQALGLSVWEVPTHDPSPDTLAARAPMAPYFASQDARVVFFTDPARR